MRKIKEVTEMNKKLNICDTYYAYHTDLEGTIMDGVHEISSNEVLKLIFQIDTYNESDVTYYPENEYDSGGKHWFTFDVLTINSKGQCWRVYKSLDCALEAYQRFTNQ